MDAQLKVAIFFRRDMNRIVQVLGIRSIYVKVISSRRSKRPFKSLSVGAPGTRSLLPRPFWKHDNVHRLQHFQYINALVVDTTNHIDQTSHKEIVFLGWIFSIATLSTSVPSKTMAGFFDINGLANFLIFRADIARVLELSSSKTNWPTADVRLCPKNIDNLSFS